MKMWMQIILMSAVAMTMVACSDSKKSNNSNSTNCFYNPYTGGCDTNAYGQYGQYGYSNYYNGNYNGMNRYQYDYYYQQSFGAGSQLCSCPNGSRPVYNGVMGMGCIRQGNLPHYAPIYYWSWSANNTFNNHYVNMPQVSNINGNQANGGCYNNVAWSCQVNQTNQCPGGTVCQATATNSPMGVCIRK